MFSSYIIALTVYFPLLVLCSPTVSSHHWIPPPLSNHMLSLVRKHAINISHHSWELGTLAEALTEYEWPHLSVFAPRSIPPPTHLRKGEAKDVLSIAEKVVARKPPHQLPLFNSSSVGDPASIGVSVLLRNWTLPSNESGPFLTAASDQLKYLLFTAPRTQKGAISHRTNQTQLWADFIYMAPPFIAYYGALLCGPEGDSLMWMAYEQVKLHREELFDEKVGLWRHIALGNGTDHKHWATGNAWAAAGALRVLATIQRSNASESMQSHQKDLMEWVGETLDGVWKYQHKNGTLLNYIDESDSFADSSSTALLAATTFRFASIAKNDTHIPAAIRALRLVRESVDSHGWLHNTVNPLKISTPSRRGHHSPEGQSFVLLLEAAVSEWESSHKNHSSLKRNSSHGKHPAHGKHSSHKNH